MTYKQIKLWIFGTIIFAIVLFAANIIIAQNQTNSVFDKMTNSDASIPPKPEGMSIEEHLSHHPELRK